MVWNKIGPYDEKLLIMQLTNSRWEASLSQIDLNGEIELLTYSKMVLLAAFKLKSFLNCSQLGYFSFILLRFFNQNFIDQSHKKETFTFRNRLKYKYKYIRASFFLKIQSRLPLKQKK